MHSQLISQSELLARNAKARTYQLTVARGHDGLRQIAGAWDAIIERMSRPHFWHRRQWFESWLDALEQDSQRAVFVVIHEDDQPIAILPLKEERRTAAGPIKVRSLELPRHDHLHLRDIAIADSARAMLSLNRIVQELRSTGELKWDMLCLWHAMADSCVMGAHALGAPSSTICQQRFECSHMPLEPWEPMQKKLSKSFRQNLRTANNRAKAIEGIRIESITTLPQLETALEAFIEVEASGWKASTGTAIKQDERLKFFYENLIHRFGPDGSCEIHLLRQNDKPIGGLFLLFSGNTLYIPKVAYDEEHSRISPVQLLLEHVFKQNENRPGITELNLTSDAGWFDVWKPAKSPVSNVYVFNSTPLGLAARLGMNAMQKIKSRQQPAAAEPSAT